ncbi:MAG: acyl-ACP--UDP-N-acetylglucosamine O-acyltransferase [Bdellovibrionales bacterium]|nr:acyl-ACP--UDP-N-acetylglucosamine O-acyltransferase [Bdellovibrionales bacterium]
MNIHSTAIISKEAEIHPEAKVGPYSIVKGRVKIGAGTIVEDHVTVGCETGEVIIGEENHIWPGAVVGGPPQDLKYKGEHVSLVMGDRNVVREFVTLNCGTQGGGGVTRIGSDCLFMAYVHVGHDCKIGNRVVVANTVAFAGHVEVEDFVTIGGIGGITQFCKVGKFAYIGGNSSINKDILPFSMAAGIFATVRGTNKIGMERAGFSKEDIQAVHGSIRTIIKGHRTKDEAISEITEKWGQSEPVQYLLDFYKNSKKGIPK